MLVTTSGRTSSRPSRIRISTDRAYSGSSLIETGASVGTRKAEKPNAPTTTSNQRFLLAHPTTPDPAVRSGRSGRSRRSVVAAVDIERSVLGALVAQPPPSHVGATFARRGGDLAIRRLRCGRRVREQRTD